jgi:hypothetical protein
MLRMRDGLGLLLAVLLSLAGCTSSDPYVKPPKPPEEYAVPPDDPRFSKPIEYPKEALDRGDPLAQKYKDTGGPGGPGPGMRGPGMGGGMGGMGSGTGGGR